MSDDDEPASFDSLDAALQAIEQLEQAKRAQRRSDREKLTLPNFGNSERHKRPVVR